MYELLKLILSLSLSGSLLILVLLCCRPVVKNRLSKRWQYYIWLVVIFRLLLPFAPETNVMENVFHGIDNTVLYTGPRLQPKQNSPILPEAGLSGPGDTPDGIGKDDGYAREPEPISATTEGIKQRIASVCLLIWLVGAVGLFIRKVTVYQSFIKYMKAGRIEISDMDLWEQVGKLAVLAGIKGAVGIYTNTLISSPLLIGFFRPCIMLPTAKLPRNDFRYTILHELTHYKRRDMFYKWLIQVTVCLHWFNPFVYLMSREVNRICELSCDEAVIKALDQQGRRAYGDTLLNAVGVGGSYKDALASITLNESKELLKERLDAIMKYKPRSSIWSAASLAMTLLIVCGAVGLGAYAAQPSLPETVRTSDNPTPANLIQSNAQSSSVDLPGTLKELPLSLDIDNGGVEIIPASTHQIIASYDSQYYDVQIRQQKNRWAVSVTGKVARMGETEDVRLQLPDIKSNLDVSVQNGDFSYDLPTDCKDEINVTAKNGGVHFSSKNHYGNSDILLTAQDKDFLIYEPPVCPEYFTKTDQGVAYQDGTKANKIRITLTGYTSVDFTEQESSVR